MTRRRPVLCVLILAGVFALSATAWAQPPVEWQFGGFLDVGYLNSFNSPSNHLFRSRGTTPRVDELNVNIGGGYGRKQATEASRWGIELTAHAGEDSKLFGFSATAPNLAGASWLRHLGPTNFSYLAPVGNGLTLQAGIFSSLVGYDSLYAHQNFTYTRPWTADFTPYLMLGVNAGYDVSEKVTVIGLVVNGYWHLAYANDVPSVGGQVAYKATKLMTLKQTVLYGPHQENTELANWRFLSNTIIERKTDRLTAALDFHVSTEVVDTVDRPRAWWVAGQLPVHWVVHHPWSITVRPEFAWDSDGRWTTFEQSVGAMTSTLEYRARFRRAQGIFRLEHRYDYSTGSGGGFFRDVQPDVVGLTSGQHLLGFAWILTFDATVRQ
jgi:Putative beta-barrel porin-2, OmpL-like. bbp2